MEVKIQRLVAKFMGLPSQAGLPLTIQEGSSWSFHIERKLYRKLVNPTEKRS